ncbi:SusC/RagA family TonB-linked outer membrane protein (plasmid) [Fulvitalea axinellae]|uniref:SusC/RagA family TonB-linked outer membrane protein n=1 Tax=Fulvitalea axinellae TaxID=1182444 RepID=A0AAU9CII3_9BACT|nr:SusC/RagA family TonB-linked outer membrane protein [Fulvitalea axinellae]
MKQILTNIWVIVALLCSGHVIAQDKVSGTVANFRGVAPLEGVVVNLIGSDGVSTFTDAEGRYELPLSSTQEVALEFAYAGFKTKRVYLNGRSVVSIRLEPVAGLSADDIVRTPSGYAPLRDFSGAGVTLTASDLDRKGYLTLDKALQGMVPGLMVESRSGTSASGGTMTLRGAGSMSGNVQPLIVVDGVIYETNLGSVSAVDGYVFNPLANINIRDIAQVTVMKDGATALYGSLAANGVILIYTKDSDVKRTRVDFSASIGTRFAPEKHRLLNASEFRNLALEQMYGADMSYEDIADEHPFMVNQAEGEEFHRYDRDTDWQDEVWKTSLTSQYGLDIQGGDDIASYNLSVGYTKNQDVVQETDFEVFDFSIGARIKLLKSLTVRPRVSLSRISSNLRGEGYNETINPGLASLHKSPMMGVYRRSEKGYALPFYDEVGAFGVSNPRSIIDNGIGSHNDFRMRAGADAVQNIAKGLDFRFNATVDLFNLKENSFVPETGVVSQLDGYARNLMGSGQRQFLSMLSEASLNYQKTFGFKHKINVRVGSRLKMSDLEEELATDINSPSDRFTVIGRGDKTFRDLEPNNGRWNMISFFGSSEYAYLDRYYLSVNVSVDGNSKFGVNERYATFPSVSGAWRITSEPFMANVSFMDDLKLRASYGLTGNDDIGYYSSRFYYVAVPFMGVSGAKRNGIPSTDLKWETTTQTNVGLDVDMLGARVRASVDVYKSVTDDLLTVMPLSSIYGSNPLFSNAGSVENTGVELGLNVDVIRTKDLILTLGGTFAKNTNEVTALGDNALNNSRYGQHIITDIHGGQVITQVGQPINTFFGYKSMGVIASAQEAEALGLTDRYGNPFRAGDIRFQDTNGDKVINEDDRTAIGSAQPDFFGSISASLRYKRFSASMLWDFVSGNDIYNYTRRGMESMTDYKNQSASVERRWRVDGQRTDMPRARFGDPMGNARFSDRWIEDGSFIRLKNVTVAYDFDIDSKIVRSLSAYVSGNTLLTLSKYLGTNPDVSYNGNVMLQGVDYGKVPQVATLMMGVKLGI